MSLTLVTAPTTEPLTVSEIKQHLLINTSTGEPVPAVITVALASPAVAGNVTAGAHRYLATFVTADGETSAGDISAIVTVADAAVNGKVELTNIPLGGSAVTQRKLYRTAAGGTSYLLLATVSNNTATVYTDNIADGSLGAAVPTANTTADPELVSWITAARQWVESYTHRACITQIWDLKLDQFPESDDRIILPKAPLSSVTSITYTDTAGVSQTWSASLYTVIAPSGPECAPGHIEPAYNEYYPSTRSIPDAVTVRFTAGYGAASAVPAGIKSAMKLMIGHWYANREAVNIGNSTSELPLAVASLLWPFKSFEGVAA